MKIVFRQRLKQQYKTTVTSVSKPTRVPLHSSSNPTTSSNNVNSSRDKSLHKDSRVYRGLLQTVEEVVVMGLKHGVGFTHQRLACLLRRLVGQKQKQDGRPLAPLDGTDTHKHTHTHTSRGPAVEHRTGDRGHQRSPEAARERERATISPRPLPGSVVCDWVVHGSLSGSKSALCPLTFNL